MSAQERFYQAKLQYEIDPADLRAALDRGEHILIVDTRPAAVFAHNHIPGAVNIPHRTMDATTTAQIDRTALVITYCDGVGCNGSTKGALNMARLGFRVKELVGGIEWWQRDGYETVRSNVTAAFEQPTCGCA
jgi:rhodanese-related sulfurtransferase